MKMVHTLKKLNNVIYQSVYSTRFISLFYAEIENDGNIFYVNAGHPPPFIVANDEVTQLESTGLIFGALPEIELRRGYAGIEPGEVLCLYTDGILERQNDLAEEFEIERLINLVKEHRTKSAQDITELIFATVDDFGNHKKWKDDATVVIIKKL
jgi:sigma-B regulation protein RsbU (phosphoserine phosphatase)